MSILFSKLLPPVNKYSIQLEVFEDHDHPPTEIWEDLSEGTLHWGMVCIKVGDGEKEGASYLGGCVIKDFEEYLAANCDGYLTDMIREAIEDCRSAGHVNA